MPVLVNAQVTEPEPESQVFGSVTCGMVGAPAQCVSEVEPMLVSEAGHTAVSETESMLLSEVGLPVSEAASIEGCELAFEKVVPRPGDV